MNNERLISSPFSVAGLTLPNRIVMPPLVIWKAGEDGYVTPDHRQHYGNSIGPGLMIVEATAVSPEGRLAGSQLGIWSDEQVDGLAELARLIHSSGAMAGIQIHHAGSKATLKHTYGEAPLVPSLTDTSPEGAQELTADDIARILAAFVAGTERAIEAGFDYIELHGAHGFLMSQFLSPNSNLRQDRWGGSLANRMRFTLEAYRMAREVARDRAAIGVRLGLADGKPGGIEPDDGLAVARELTALGCPILHTRRRSARGGGSGRFAILRHDAPGRTREIQHSGDRHRGGRHLHAGASGGGSHCRPCGSGGGWSRNPRRPRMGRESSYRPRGRH